MTRTCLLFRNDNSFKVLKYNISQSDIQLTKIVTERYPAKGDSCSSRIFYDLPEVICRLQALKEIYTYCRWIAQVSAVVEEPFMTTSKQ